MKKILYIVLDGLGGTPDPKLGGKTELESAKTPNMDSLAQKAKLGLMDPIAPGIAPESDAAVLSILGYDVNEYYTGRGPLEAHGADIEVKDGDLAWRANFATVDENTLKILDRRAGRNLTTEEAKALAEEINERVKLDGADFIFKATVGHRGVLVIRKKDGRLSANVENIDPGYKRHGPYSIALSNPSTEVQKCVPLDNSEEAKEAARLTDEFVMKAFEVLKNSEINKKRKQEGKKPANIILLRDAGDSLPKIPTLQTLYGLNFGSIVEMPVERGIALLTGMKEVPIEDSTDYKLWAEKVLYALEHFDGVYAHLKGPDVPGHDGNYEKKIKSIEDIDFIFFENLLPKLDFSKVVVAVTADHSTPCALKSHSEDPVPLMIATSGITPDGPSYFGESACKNGSIGRIKGTELLPLLVKTAK
ncbi:MAG TPA: alkaline phosphatase family protein [Dictyoglomaceae bacterium]|nr:alkaline phosphatase family protein [Dictyoglomaceae bacterium]